MVSGIDLKPLTEDSIKEMGYENQDLWMVKIGSVVFGPYETESLKHYVGDNEHLFENALASKANETEWNPFWAYTKFQRRKPQVVQGQVHEGPFWIMDFGLKTGPFSFHDIDKKIEFGLLVMTDHISIDEGQSWIKIFELEGFDRRTYSPDDLPMAPLESSFQKAKITLVEKMDTPHFNSVDEMAELAWQGHQTAKILPFKIDEMTLKTMKETQVSPALKWALPGAAALVFTIFTSGYFFFSGSENPELAADTQDEKPFYQNKVARKSRVTKPRPVMPASRESFDRTPASVSYPKPMPAMNDSSRYPTHVETHDDYYPDPEPAYPERDPLDGPVTDAEQRIEEHSLVGNTLPAEDVSLDATMNGVDPQQDPSLGQPVVEEVSDF